MDSPSLKKDSQSLKKDSRSPRKDSRSPRKDSRSSFRTLAPVLETLDDQAVLTRETAARTSAQCANPPQRAQWAPLRRTNLADRKRLQTRFAKSFKMKA